MAYEVKIKIDGNDMYKRLTPAEKEKFNEVAISKVERYGNEVIITGIAIENEKCDNNIYGMYSNGKPVLRELD